MSHSAVQAKRADVLSLDLPTVCLGCAEGTHSAKMWHVPVILRVYNSRGFISVVSATTDGLPTPLQAHARCPEFHTALGFQGCEGLTPARAPPLSASFHT